MSSGADETVLQGDRQGTAADGARPDNGGIRARPPSLWEATTAPARVAFQPLNDRVEADLLVIGGGFTGLSAALHAAEAGHRVVLIEASEIGRGASGRNNGQIIPTLTRPDPENLVEKFGGDAGERFVGLIRDSANTLFDLVRRYGIDCAAAQTGWVQPVHTPGRMAIAERRVRQWGSRGAEVELLDRKAMAKILGTDRYFGGWTNRSGGHVNPLALARGLADAAFGAGASIHTNSPATSVEHRGDRWIARTPEGEVSALSLVLATNAYTTNIFDDVRREVVPVLSWQMATRPLTDAERAAIIPNRQAMSDTHGDLWFMRHSADGRLVTGGGLIFATNGAERLKRIVSNRLGTLFPALQGITFDYVWNGRLAMTTDYTPRIHQLGANGFGWDGCNGRGVALAVSLGRELALAATGKPVQDLALPLTPVRPIPFHGIASRVAPFKLLQYRWNDLREI